MMRAYYLKDGVSLYLASSVNPNRLTFSRLVATTTAAESVAPKARALKRLIDSLFPSPMNSSKILEELIMDSKKYGLIGIMRL